jgi:hypothetical protein
LKPPVQNIGYDNLLILGHRHEMHPSKLAWSMPRLAKSPEDLPILIKFDDPVKPAIGHPHVLIGR